MDLVTWQNYYKDPSTLIIQASSMNEDDAWMPFPIGMGYKYISQMHRGRLLQIGSHANTVSCSIYPTTDGARRAGGQNRQSIIKTLEANGIYNEYLPADRYFESLPSYKFVISPEGNGIDCHRHYEALLAGCIPIIEKNKLIEEKYKGCPILYTTDYSEITPQYLNEKYKEMTTTLYDFSCLSLDNYSDDTQLNIKSCGNYWASRLIGRKIYTIADSA